MRFKLVETGKSYAEAKKSASTTEAVVTADDREAPAPSIIWETGNIDQIRSLLVLREAELVVARAQITGNDYWDWFAKGRIRDLEQQVAALKRWLVEAMGKREHGDQEDE